MHNKALCVIFMSVNDNAMWEIVGEIFASIAWKKLEKLYFVKLLTNHLYLKKRMYNLRMSENMPIK